MKKTRSAAEHRDLEEINADQRPCGFIAGHKPSEGGSYEKAWMHMLRLVYRGVLLLVSGWSGSSG
jgi:hypothetical protein